MLHVNGLLFGWKQKNFVVTLTWTTGSWLYDPVRVRWDSSQMHVANSREHLPQKSLDQDGRRRSGSERPEPGSACRTCWRVLVMQCLKPARSDTTARLPRSYKVRVSMDQSCFGGTNEIDNHIPSRDQHVIKLCLIFAYGYVSIDHRRAKTLVQRSGMKI